MNVIRHDAGGIKLITALVVAEQKAFQHDISRLQRKLPPIPG